MKTVLRFCVCVLLAFVAGVQNVYAGTPVDKDFYTAWRQDNLKGKVKQMVTSTYFCEENFDIDFTQNDAYMVEDKDYKADGSRMLVADISYKFDSYKRIVTEEGNDYTRGFDYDEAGRISAISSSWEGESSGDRTETIIYADLGEVHKINAYVEGNEIEITVTYEYLHFDEQGNWIEARVTEHEKTTFMEESSDESETYKFIIREISYY